MGFSEGRQRFRDPNKQAEFEAKQKAAQPPVEARATNAPRTPEPTTPRARPPEVPRDERIDTLKRVSLDEQDDLAMEVDGAAEDAEVVQYFDKKQTARREVSRSDVAPNPHQEADEDQEVMMTKVEARQELIDAIAEADAKKLETARQAARDAFDDLDGAA